MSWRPTASTEAIRARSDLLQIVRKFFTDRDFLEVQTPTLSRDTVIDRHLDPIVVAGDALGIKESEQPWYLQTSPEFAMKRLVASGLNAIFQIGPAYRADESGPMHNPEFTMLEWYRVGDDYSAAIELLLALTVEVLSQHRRPCPEVRIASYQDVWLEQLGIDPFQNSADELAAWAASEASLGVTQSWSNDKDDWLHLIFDGLIQPKLGLQPLILTHYPASQSALAKICPTNPLLAERFELFIDGIELANGYHELTSATELEQRNALVNAQRQHDHKSMLPAESRLLQAMREELPSCGGCALGMDRLLMVLLNKRELNDVLCFPIDRA